VANRQLADNTIVVFRADDLQGRTVLLVLSGAAGAARSEDKKAPQPPPPRLKLSYIVDAPIPTYFGLPKGSSEHELWVIRAQPAFSTLFNGPKCPLAEIAGVRASFGRSLTA
jgi:hypothetical protein